jgi:hypothetical protein
MALIKKLDSFVSNIENIGLPQSSYYLYFFGTIAFRALLEAFFSYRKMPDTVSVLLEYPLFYIAILLWSAFIVSKLTGKTFGKVFKVFLLFLPLIFIAPTIDGLFSPTAASSLNYIDSAGWGQFIENFLTYFGLPFGASGPTTGIFVEIFIMMFAIALFCYSCTKKLSAAIPGALSIYAVVFILGSTNFIRTELNNLMFVGGNDAIKAISRDKLLIVFSTMLLPAYLNYRKFAIGISSLIPFSAVILGFCAGLTAVMPLGINNVLPFDILFITISVVMAALAVEKSDIPLLLYSCYLTIAVDLFFLPLVLALCGTIVLSKTFNNKLPRAFFWGISILSPIAIGNFLARRGIENISPAIAIFIVGLMVAEYFGKKLARIIWVLATCIISIAMLFG